MNENETLSSAEVLLEVNVEAPIEKVWKAFVEETSAWWHPEFYTKSGAEVFHIEPKLGGWMYEDWGGGAGQIWATVMGVEAPSFLQAMGDNSKEFGGPSRGIMTWRLKQTGATTVLRLEHQLFGRVTEATRASLLSGWELLFRDCLKPFVETGARPDPATVGSADCQAS